MKKNYFLITCLVLSCCQTFSQGIPINQPDHNKPALFSDVQDSIPISYSQLSSLFNYSLGQPIDINFAVNFIYSGLVASTIIKYSGTINTVIIRSSNRTGSHFTLSKIMGPGGSILFKGRIVSFDHDDGFDLVSKNGSYWLKKVKRYNLIME